MTELKSITLKKPHAHRGVKYAAGDTITAAPHIYDWLIARGVGEPLKQEPMVEQPDPATKTRTKKATKTKE